ncbi:MAG: DUF4116 domain-containing protein [Treponema sp.]|nr:DUF4116 domain-containing protein [Treponema sp.]
MAVITNKEGSLKIAEFWLEAVKEDESAFQYVPNEHMTVELCLEAMKKNNMPSGLFFII